MVEPTDVLLAVHAAVTAALAGLVWVVQLVVYPAFRIAGPTGAWPAYHRRHTTAMALVVAVLSSALPYSLELVALRSLAPGVFGVLLSLEPAAAALAGLVVLDQRLHADQLVGMAAVVAAGVLVLGRQRGPGAPIGSDPDTSGTMAR